MLSMLRPVVILFALLTLMTGVVYPLAVTGLAQMLFSVQANGSLIEKDGELMGSVLIGQDFREPKYFWPRPSATAGYPYNAFDPAALTGSSGSNLGPLSMDLMDSVKQRIADLQAADPGNPLPLPVDLVTASASGLNPHISLAAAYYQARRVARVRRLDEQEVHSLIVRLTEPRQVGVLGEPRINVLLLNLVLDALK